MNNNNANIKAIRDILDDFEDHALAKYKAKVIQATIDLVSNTPFDTGEATAGWSLDKPLTLKDRATIVNDVEHIVQLNDGHSKQAPKFFVEQVLLRAGFTFSS